MDFACTELQNEIVSLAQQILADHCNDTALKALDGPQRFDQTLWQVFGEAGLVGLTLPEAAGGMGFGLLELCLVAEQIGRHTAAIPLIYHELACAHLHTRQTLNRCHLDGEQLQGEIDAVPYGQHADTLLLAVGQQLLRVDLDQPGVTRQPQAITSGEATAQLRFEQVSAVVIGDANDLERLQQQLTGMLCAQQLGNVDAALSMSADYTREHRQFGVPIGSFQAVSHRLADAYIAVANLRNTVHFAVCELRDNANAARAVMVAKYWAGETGHQALAAFQHVHGGIGADRDYGLWRHTVLSKQLEMQMGSSREMAWLLGQSLTAA